MLGYIEEVWQRVSAGLDLSVLPAVLLPLHVPTLQFTVGNQPQQMALVTDLTELFCGER